MPMALAENSGLSPIETLASIKSRQVKEENSRLGVDCMQTGTNGKLSFASSHPELDSLQTLFCALPARNLQPQLPAVTGTACGCQSDAVTQRDVAHPGYTESRSRSHVQRLVPSSVYLFHHQLLLASLEPSHSTQKRDARANIDCDRHARALCHRPAHLQEAAAPACDAIVPHGPEGESADFFGRLTISRLCFSCSPFPPVTFILGPNGVSVGLSRLPAVQVRHPDVPPQATVTRHGFWPAEASCKSH